MTSAQLIAGGTSDTFSNGLIVNKLQVRGNAGGELLVNYQDQFPRIPRQVWLAE